VPSIIAEFRWKERREGREGKRRDGKVERKKSDKKRGEQICLKVRQRSVRARENRITSEATKELEEQTDEKKDKY